MVGPQKTCEAAAQGRRGGRSRSLGRPASSFFRENASLVIKTSNRHGGAAEDGVPMSRAFLIPRALRLLMVKIRRLESTHSAQVPSIVDACVWHKFPPPMFRTISDPRSHDPDPQGRARCGVGRRWAGVARARTLAPVKTPETHRSS